MSSGRFFGFLAPESYSSPEIPKNVTGFSSQYKCWPVFLSRIFVSKLKKWSIYFSLLRNLVSQYCLEAELQSEISNIEWSTDAYKGSGKLSRLSLTLPPPAQSLPPLPAPSQPGPVLPLRKTGTRGGGGGRLQKNLGKLSEHFKYQCSITAKKFWSKALEAKGNLILPLVLKIKARSRQFYLTKMINLNNPALKYNHLEKDRRIKGRREK